MTKLTATPSDIASAKERAQQTTPATQAWFARKAVPCTCGHPGGAHAVIGRNPCLAVVGTPIVGKPTPRCDCRAFTAKDG